MKWSHGFILDWIKTLTPHEYTVTYGGRHHRRNTGAVDTHKYTQSHAVGITTGETLVQLTHTNIHSHMRWASPQEKHTLVQLTHINIHSHMRWASPQEKLAHINIYTVGVTTGETLVQLAHINIHSHMRWASPQEKHWCSWHT